MHGASSYFEIAAAFSWQFVAMVALQLIACISAHCSV